MPAPLGGIVRSSTEAQQQQGMQINALPFLSQAALSAASDVAPSFFLHHDEQGWSFADKNRGSEEGERK